jgi:predicted outer membrane protein
MQPQQPANYDFIMNPGTPPRKSMFGGGSSLAMRVLMVVGGVFVLMIIAAVLLQVIGGGGAKFNKGAMLSVVQDQAEIVRLGDRGVKDSTSQAIKNFAITTSLSIKTEQAVLLKYLAENGYKPNDKTLVFKQSAATDTQLDEAKSSSTFDTAYAGIMKQSLEAYKQDLTTAYNSAKSDSTKSVLKVRYSAADTLLVQLTGQSSTN